MATASIQSELLEEFEANGYVLIKNIFDPEKDFQPIIDDYDKVLAEVAERWFAEGKISSTYSEYPFMQRLVKVISDTGEPWIDYFNISLPLWDVTGKTPYHFPEPLFRIMTKPRLLDHIELFLGPEIYANPIQHVRIKPPLKLIPEGKQNALIARTNWHQDLGVTTEDANETNLLTVWIPITDATIENGCLQMIPGSHRDPLVEHCPRADGDIEIPPRLRAGQVTPVPVQRGDVLFLHKLVKHDSGQNYSDNIRWSYDLRYQPIGQPTGRPEWPGFVARSRQNPESVTRSAKEVTGRWLEVREWMAETNAHLLRRWKGGSPYCGA